MNLIVLKLSEKCCVEQQIKSTENLSNYFWIVMRVVSYIMFYCSYTLVSNYTMKNILNIYQELHKTTVTIVDRQNKIQENMDYKFKKG